MAPPLLILGVSRSGTTLLRVMLDRNSQLAVPDESYFVPLLADRHLLSVDRDEFLDDLRRLKTVREWALPLDKVRARLADRMPVGRAIAAIYEVYAKEHGKARWGDKTPMYMRHLPLLRRLFPDAQYVHLIRDGRNAAVSFLSMLEGIAFETWGHPRSPAGFASHWRTDVAAARRHGRRVGTDRYLEVRYEDLVSDTEGTLRRICLFADLPFEPAMTNYGDSESAQKPHQQSLKRPPTPSLRDWRTEMTAADAGEFESVAGDLLRELGYETDANADVNGKLRLAAYRARMGAWRAATFAYRRSPLWRRRHPPLQ
jgi:NADH:ubiquinone oxidoreductase subunit